MSPVTWNNAATTAEGYRQGHSSVATRNDYPPGHMRHLTSTSGLTTLRLIEAGEHLAAVSLRGPGPGGDADTTFLVIRSTTELAAAPVISLRSAG